MLMTVEPLAKLFRTPWSRLSARFQNDHFGI
jgi:hypothetical protein